MNGIMYSRALTLSISLRQTGVFADLSIACRAYEFPIHRGILACQSTYFKGAFQAMERNSIGIRLEMHDEDPSALRAILRYLYTGELSVPYDNLFVLHGPEMPSIDVLRKVYTLAIKCDLPQPKQMVAEHYRNTMAEKWPEGYGVLLAIALVATFEDDLLEPEVLRDATLDAAVVHSEELLEDPDVYGMLKGEPLRALALRLSKETGRNDESKEQ